MPRNSIGSWWLKCPNCGHEYRITNYGRRQARRPDGVIVQTTVHEAGCLGYRLLSSRERLLYRV